MPSSSVAPIFSNIGAPCVLGLLGSRRRITSVFTATSTKLVLVNVLGGELEPCCFDPVTGFYRDGYCHTEGADVGFHVVCTVMTEEFLAFSVEAGNDLVTPQPQWQFPGLQPGDRWCVVAARWQEALEAVGVPSDP